MNEVRNCQTTKTTLFTDPLQANYLQANFSDVEQAAKPVH